MNQHLLILAAMLHYGTDSGVKCFLIISWTIYEGIMLLTYEWRIASHRNNET